MKTGQFVRPPTTTVTFLIPSLFSINESGLWLSFERCIVRLRSGSSVFIQVPSGVEWRDQTLPVLTRFNHVQHRGKVSPRHSSGEDINSGFGQCFTPGEIIEIIVLHCVGRGSNMCAGTEWARVGFDLSSLSGRFAIRIKVVTI